MRLRLVCKQGVAGVDPAGSVVERLLVWISILKWDLCQWFVLLSSHTHTHTKKKGNLCGFPELLTHTCITRAERTKLHLQVLCVRLNVKQVQTCLGFVFWFFLKPQGPLKSCRWSRWRDRQRGGEGGGEAAGSSLAAGELCREVWKS